MRDPGAPELKAAAPAQVESRAILPWVTKNPAVAAWLWLERTSPLACWLRILSALTPAVLCLSGVWHAPKEVAWALVLVAGAVLWVERRSLRPRPAWMDPSVTGVNRLPPHTPLVAYETLDEAVERNRGSCKSVVSLNGTWKFSLAPGPLLGPSNFDQTSFDDSEWSDITVPGHWQLQDAGRADIPIYTNTNYPFPNTPPFVPESENPTGFYRRSFAIPADWDLSASRVILIFRGVDAACHVWVNGLQVGFSKDSRTAAEFDITSALGESAAAAPGGRHVLAVRVPRWSDGSFLEDQDHWLLSGLYRDVELLRVPAAARIADYTVRATLLEKGPSSTLMGRIEVEVELDGEGVAPMAGAELECTLVDTAAANGSSGSASGASNGARHKGSGVSVLPACGKPWRQSWGDINGLGESRQTCLFAAEIPAPRAWSAEDPQLYTVVVGLKIPGSNRAQFESSRVGFRNIVIEKGQLKVNGAAIMVAGVNRHEHEPATGKTVDEKSMRRDILLLKKSNFNAVRNCHYPNHWRWYELCDELGLYACDEANLETHGQVPMARLSHDPYWRRAYLDRMQRTVRASKNHACIILWSLGNESGDGPNLAASRAWVKRWEPSRPVHYEGGGHLVEGSGRTDLTDVVCPMYPTPKLVEELGRPGTGELRPVVLCEYSHAMGNSSGNLHEYWDLFWDEGYPRLQGGFVWDFVDQGLDKIHPTTGQKYWAFGGDFGDVFCDGYQRFCCNGLCFPDRSPHPALFEAKHLQRPVHVSLLDAPPESGANEVRLQVKNRYSFLSLEHLSLSWEALSDGGGIDGSSSSDGVVAKGSLALPAGGPGPGKTVDVLLSPKELDADALARAAGVSELFIRVTARLNRDMPWAESGHVVAMDQFLVEAVAPRKDKPAPPDQSASTAAGVAAAVATRGGGPKGKRPGATAMDEEDEELVVEDPAPAKDAKEPANPSALEKNDLTKPLLSTPTQVRGGGSGSGNLNDPMVLVHPRSCRWEIAFSRSTGRIARMRYGERDLITPGQGPELCFVRAATENDRAGYDTLVRFVAGAGTTNVVTKMFPLSSLSHYQRWLSVGLTASQPPLQRLLSFVVDPTRKSSIFSATATWSIDMAATGTPIFEAKIAYQVLGNGAVVLECSATPKMALPACLSLARVGVAMQAAPGLSQVSWFGRGPHESYWDRKRGALVGLYRSSVADLAVPYLHPTESGGRSDVRWTALTDGGGSGGGGLLLRGGEPMQMNSTYHSPKEVEVTDRYLELPPRDPATHGAYVHLDYKHMGVGGDNTWMPDTVHSEFLVAPSAVSFTVWMAPLAPQERPEAKAAKLVLAAANSA